MKAIFALAGALTILTVYAFSTPLFTPQDVWDEVATLRAVTLPDPLEKLVWRTDLDAALDESKSSGRPLFITFRCLPCKQCADFDANVLEGSESLTPLLRRFITVRLTDANQLDMSIFPAEGFQDFDLSWWGYFLSPEKRVYAVFGGKDHVSDTTRISEAALVNTMRRVLEHHYDPRRPAWNIDGDAPDPQLDAVRPTDLPGYDSWLSNRPEMSPDCLHCHQVVEILRQPALDSGQFKAQTDLAVWPLPENVGIELDRDHGVLVTSVEAGSAAGQAGVQVGDELLAAGNRRIFGQADFRGVLHREANPTGSILIRWLRDGRLMSGTLELDEGWRETVVWWRASVSGGNIGSGPGFWPLKGPREGVPAGEMAVKPWFGQNPRATLPQQAGLRPRHVIIAVDGESPDIVAREFQTWFRLGHERGAWVVLTVLDRGERREIRYRLPE